MDLYKYLQDYSFVDFKEKYPLIFEYLRYSSEFFAMSRGLCGEHMNDVEYYAVASKLADINMLVMRKTMTEEDYENVILNLKNLLDLDRMMGGDDKRFNPQYLKVVDENGDVQIITVIEADEDGFVHEDSAEMDGEYPIIDDWHEDD